MVYEAWLLTTIILAFMFSAGRLSQWTTVNLVIETLPVVCIVDICVSNITMTIAGITCDAIS